MRIALGITVCLVCMYGCAEAQLKQEPLYIPQQVKYDDERPNYGGIHYKSSISNEPLSNSHEAISIPPQPAPAGSPYPQQEHFHLTETYRPIVERPYGYESGETGGYPSSHNQPQEVYYSRSEPRSSYKPTEYHPQSHKFEPKQLQLNHGTDLYKPPISHASSIYPQPVVPEQRQPSHASSIYPQPAVPEHRQPSHASLIYPQPAVPEQRQPSHASAIHPQSLEASDPKQLPALKSPGPQQSTINQTPSNSRVVRDPRLPLYFTMYEKRIVQDPVDKYGKGPWRYLTYGHGITYGSKEPGKVFERGYGYIRALGRDHCKLPEHLCPKKDTDKPFEYEGRKEPYFGFRPH